eukprot:5568459-Amphidinium_carterae.1
MGHWITLVVAKEGSIWGTTVGCLTHTCRPSSSMPHRDVLKSVGKCGCGQAGGLPKYTARGRGGERV